MSYTPEEEEELLKECENALNERDQVLEEEPYEGWESDPPVVEELDDEPPTRVVVLEEERHHAQFCGPPIKKLWVYHIDAEAPLELPYFDPAGQTDEELRAKVKKYLTFS